MGFREGTCGTQTQRSRCRVPCNWKKEFGGEVGRGRRAGEGPQPHGNLGRHVEGGHRPPGSDGATLPPADCKYKFESWGACDGGTGTKVRQGTLKKARYNAQCQETIRVTKPCTPKTKAKAKGQQGGQGWDCHKGLPPTCERNG